MSERKAELERKSKETEIKLELNIDGKGQTSIKTQIGILDHMLELFAFHGFFDLNLNVSGFSFKVAGQPTVKVSGSKLNTQAKNALKRAKRGETVQIFDINAKIAGNSSYKLPRITPVFVELTN